MASVANIFRSRATLLVGGQACLMTQYWDFNGSSTPTAAATEALARVRAMLNSFAAIINSSVTVSFDTTVIGLLSSSGQALSAQTGATPSAVTFSNAGDLLPLSTQMLFTLNTGVFIRGRALRGRTFVPGITESNSTTGIGPLSGAVTALNTAIGLLGTTISEPITQVVWSRPTTPGGTDGQAWAVTGRSASTKWAVQKNRRS